MSGPIKVAVIIANYNNAEYIAETVRSVIEAKEAAASAFGALSLHYLIGDDRSTDNSREVITALGHSHVASDVRMDYVFMKQNRKPNAIFNVLIPEAVRAGDTYAVIIDSDDRLAEDFFSMTLPRLQEERARDHRVGYIYTDLLFMKEDGAPLGRGVSQDFAAAATEAGGYRIPTPALTLTECLVSGVPYDEGIHRRINQARYKKLKEEKGWAGVHIPEIGYHYRVFQERDSISNTGRVVAQLDVNPTRPVSLAEVWEPAPSGTL